MQGRGSVTVAPNGVWTVAIEIAVRSARDAIPAAAGAILAEADLPAETAAAVRIAAADTSGALQVAEAALDEYARAPTEESRCRVHSDLRLALTGTVQVITIAQQLHARLSPVAVAALGALGPVVDMLQPGCAYPAIPTAQHRIHAALSGDSQ